MEEQQRFCVDLEKNIYREFRQKAFDVELPMTEVSRRLISMWLDGDIAIAKEEKQQPDK